MKKWTKLALPLVLLVVLTVSVLSAKSMSDISNYGKLINYVGIVRGASQRVVKLETNGQPDNGLIVYVTEILEELQSGEGKYGLQRTGYEVFNKELTALSREWDAIKDEINRVRDGADESTLLVLSEEFFTEANDTVFSIEEYSGERSASLATQLIVTAVICLFFSVAVIIIYVKRYFELRRTADILVDQAGRDKLTGALNIERFCADAQKIMSEHPQLKFAVAYIDFDNFKYINDVFGYEVGDRILKEYTQLMQASLRENELFARNMADCFAVLRCYEDREEMLRSQKETDAAFLKTEVLPDKHNMSVVCGFCCVEDVLEKLDVQDLIDRANYAKKTIKNVAGEYYALYNESIRRKMFAEIRISDRMESALTNREFVVYLQPKVTPSDGIIRAAEALVRWKKPEGGFYMPGEFIPVFEKNHTIAILDQYMFEAVCSFLSQRIKENKRVVPISVNVSKIRFYTPGFVESYTEIRDRYEIPYNMIEIEFTETVACENPEYMLRIVRELHENGFLCSLDDFGSGYSSLGMLKDISIDILKLDALFFRDSIDMSKAETIIQGLLQMIRRLDIKTVAEGIETAEQVELLWESGCDLIQGFYFYKPMPAEEFARLLEEGA